MPAHYYYLFLIARKAVYRMVSIYDIVYDYIDMFYADERLIKEDKKTIHKEIKKILDKGWCADDIKKCLRDVKRKDPKRRSLEVSRMFTARNKPKLNLLKPDVFYYHNDLRLTCGPPKRKLDIDSGEITVINETYFLEMKASYSVEDLVKYYMRQVGESHKSDVNRFKGSMIYLLKRYSVEEILFMIDTMINMSKAEDLPLPDSPLDCQRHHKQAKEVINLKTTETIYAGGNKIVRKKRTRTS